MACAFNNHVTTNGTGIPLPVTSLVEGQPCDCGLLSVHFMGATTIEALVYTKNGQLKGR
jgi:hypothetical protein